MPEIPNFDFTVPAAIIGLCALIMLITWWLTRPKPSAQDLPEPEPEAAPPPAVANEELTAWHQHHGATVQAWIENHESVLKRVSDSGLQLDLMNNDLTAGHDRLAGPIRDAITSHPAPPMRAQLSALVVSGEATLHALMRSEYQDAERQHVTYLEYRDQWLHRLRQFSTGDRTIRHLQNIPDQTPPDIWQ